MLTIINDITRLFINVGITPTPESGSLLEDCYLATSRRKLDCSGETAESSSDNGYVRSEERRVGKECRL